MCLINICQHYVLLANPHAGTSHGLEPATLTAAVMRQLPQDAPGGSAFGGPFLQHQQPHHSRSMPPPGSPTEDAMLCSRHSSSSSFASASGCSRSSSGIPGLATECGMVDSVGAAAAAVAACGDGGQPMASGGLPAMVALQHKVRTGHWTYDSTP